MSERRYNYTSEAKGRFSQGEQVTLTMENSCQVKAVIQSGSEKSGSFMRDLESREPVYAVKIVEPGPHSGLSYYAPESRLRPGWADTSDGCDTEATTDAVATKNSVLETTELKFSIDPMVLFVLVGGAIVAAGVLRGARTAH